MSFDVAADDYFQFMGRYSEPLAREFMTVLDLHHGQRVLDVGAGPGALTAPLVELLGPDAVAAVDPSRPFVEALRERLPGVDVRSATAEQLPFEDGSFDTTVAQLVVHFMTDPVAGIREMSRVTAPGGVVAASTWDLDGHRAPLSLIWRAASDLDPAVDDETGRAGTGEGGLAIIFSEAGLTGIHDGALTVTVPYATFDAWWRPFTLGVGPAGAYVAALDPEHREALRRRAEELLPPAPGAVDVTAWVASGQVG